MKVPFIDLKQVSREVGADVRKMIAEQIDNTDFVLGREVSLFEKAFSRFVGSRYGVGVGSGTDALVLGLRALEIGPGDEVILPANSFIATAFAVTLVGAKPVLVDALPDTRQIDSDLVKKAITRKTKAVIPVHLHGRCADMNPLFTLAKKHKLHLIEDACQAHGASYRGQKAGSMGSLACFSFYPGKNLGGMGEGGMVTTNREEIAEMVRQLRNVGQRVKYVHEQIGYNSRLDTLQAGVLRIKLKTLSRDNAARRRHAAYYNKKLKNVPVTIPVKDELGKPVFHLYVIEADDRNGLQKHLESRGIASGIHYPVPIHMQPCYKGIKGSFPVTEKMAERMLSLPMFPGLTREQLDAVVNAIQEFCD